jgi:hypothetical protein
MELCPSRWVVLDIMLRLTFCSIQTYLCRTRAAQQRFDRSKGGLVAGGDGDSQSNFMGRAVDLQAIPPFRRSTAARSAALADPKSGPLPPPNGRRYEIVLAAKSVKQKPAQL